MIDSANSFSYLNNSNLNNTSQEINSSLFNLYIRKILFNYSNYYNK